MLLLLAGCGPPPTNEAPRPPAPARPTAVATEPAGDAVAPGEGDDGLDALIGRWRVTAVHVAPAAVQALVENDPADLGATLDIARDRLSWRPHAGGGEFTDVCGGPRLTLDGQVSCRDGAFGPPGARLVAAGDGIDLDWYDGATLRLKRTAAVRP